MDNAMMAQELSDEQLEMVTGGHGISHNGNNNGSYNFNNNGSYNFNGNNSHNNNAYFYANTSVNVSKSILFGVEAGNGNTVLQGNSFGD
jgi:hypothetical protein